eukprot:57506-Pelagomonas_calceolata.AAC.1
MQGNISRWLKKEGEEVGPGMLLAEVETDKATMEWEAQEEGYVAKILKPDGAKDVAVGEPVYVLVEEQSMVPAFKDFQGNGKQDSQGKNRKGKLRRQRELPLNQLRKRKHIGSEELGVPSRCSRMCLFGRQALHQTWDEKLSLVPGDLASHIITAPLA